MACSGEGEQHQQQQQQQQQQQPHDSTPRPRLHLQKSLVWRCFQNLPKDISKKAILPNLNLSLIPSRILLIVHEIIS